MPTALLGPGLHAVAAYFLQKGTQHLSQHAHYEEITIEAISVDSSQNSRSDLPKIAELAASIREVGLLEPVVVRKLPEGGFALVAGFRRFAAVKSLEWPFVPAMVLFEMTAERARVLNLAENSARQNLRLYDTMRTVWDLYDKGVHVEVLSRDAGIYPLKAWRMVRIWPRLSSTLKTRWAAIEDAAWEPSLAQVERWSKLASFEEQIAAWNEWAGQDEVGQEVGEKPPETKKRARTARRPVREVRSMLKILGDSPLDEAQKRALLWSIGRRQTL